MLEALSSLYNRIFASSASREAPQQSTTPSQKGWFFGHTISFLFGPRTNSSLKKTNNTTSQPSLLQKIFPWFFSATSTPDNSLDEIVVSIPKGKEKEEKALVQKQGNKKIEDTKSLGPINQDLADTLNRYTTHQVDYLDSFNKEGNRGFSYTLENPFVTNRNTERPAGSDYTSDIEKDPRVIQAHKVIATVSTKIFPDVSTLHDRETLANNLKGISQQALFATPLLAFSEHLPSEGACIVQGNVSNADFSYSITAPRKIEIKATAEYNNPGNTLLEVVKNGQNQLEVRPFSFSSDDDNNPTGKITGTVSLTIIATVGEDGKISKLDCTSLETSWNATSNFS